jgi:hypothetical protein
MGAMFGMFDAEDIGTAVLRIVGAYLLPTWRNIPEDLHFLLSTSPVLFRLH